MTLDPEKLLLHLEWAETAGHDLRFEPWRDSLPLEALLDIHEREHADMAAHPHPEGDHSHPYGTEDFEDDQDWAEP